MARPHGEGDVGEFVPFFGIGAGKPFGAKFLRFAPELGMSVQQVGADEHVGARPDREAAQFIRIEGAPREEPAWRVETQRFLFSPPKDFPGFAEAIWADAIPKLLQARLIESFENYDLAHAPLRSDVGQADYQLLIDVRNFQIKADPDPTAEISLSVRILAKDGHVVASRAFSQSRKLDKLDPASAQRRAR